MKLPGELLQAIESDWQSIPDGLCARPKKLDADMDHLAFETADAYIASQIHADGPMWLVEFDADADFWVCEPQLKPYPASFYAALVSRMEQRILTRNLAVVRTVLNLGAYKAWLQKIGLPDSNMSRIAWAKAQVSP
jgi:hypothetical protein